MSSRLHIHILLLSVATIAAACLLCAASPVSAAASASCGGIVDPYSGVCLSAPVPVQACDEATSIQQCGCKTCALPGCSGCIKRRQCSAGGPSSSSSSSCACPAGWVTEFAEFTCSSYVGTGNSNSGILASAKNTTAPAALNVHASAPAPLAQQLRQFISSFSSVITSSSSPSTSSSSFSASAKSVAFVPVSSTGTLRNEGLVPRSSQMYMSLAARVAMWAPALFITLFVLFAANFLIFGI